MFFEESSELLDRMEACLLELDVHSLELEDLNTVFHAVHSIKGGASTFGFADIIDMAHSLETLLDKLRKGELELHNEMIEIFLKASDVIKRQFAEYRGDGQVDPTVVAEVHKALRQFSEVMPMADKRVSPPQPDPTIHSQIIPSDATRIEATSNADKPSIKTLDASIEIPETAGDNNEASIKQGCLQSLSRQQIADKGLTAQAGKSKTQKNPESIAASSEISWMRVRVEKVDQIVNLIGELVITQTMLVQTTSQMDPVIHENLLSRMDQLARNTQDLQVVAMSIRMLPISLVFSRFPRIVHDLAMKLNKQVELKTMGADTRLDKSLIEKITDPLTHLVRNSLDHGIELPEERMAANKPAKGTITLRASHQGNSIIIEVSDDGGGLHRERILEKAKAYGLSTHDGMSDQEVWMLIFESGFSTVEAITDISGRGMGMDIVKCAIQAMGGYMEIHSIPGTGTTISIRLPLTLVILDGLSVAAGDQVFIVPLIYILESLQPKTGDIKTVNGQGYVVQIRGDYLPVIVLQAVLNIRSEAIDIDEGILVVLEAEGHRAALLVDALLGQHQVVIKSLESNYRRVRGISGATIMGDGKVAFILNIIEIVMMSSHELIKESHRLHKSPVFISQPKEVACNMPQKQTTRAVEPDGKPVDRPSGEFLIFRLGQETYGIDILKVQEIRAYDGVTQIANTPDFIKGVINLRGIIVPIIDMRIKLKLGSVEYDALTIVIILNVLGRVVGIVVDGVPDVINFDMAQIQPVPVLGSVIGTEYIMGLGTAGDQMVILIDIEKLMGSAEMDLIDQAVK